MTAPPAKQMRIESLDEPLFVQPGAAREQFNTTFLSLNDDIFYAVFKKLSLDDVCTLSKTCKRLYALGSDHFMLRYKSKIMVIDTNWQKMEVKEPFGEQFVECFAKCVQNIVLESGCFMLRYLHQLRIFYGEEKWDDFSPIKTLQLRHWRGRLVENHGLALAAIVKNVEELTLFNTKLKGDLYHCMLRHMPNLKRLKFWCPEVAVNDITWMSQKYPKLECLALYLKNPDYSAEDVKQFLSLNPNIKFFSMTEWPLLNIDMLIENEIRVNELFIDFEGDITKVLADLEILCAQGSCKHLHLKSKNADELLDENIDQLLALSPFIEGLYFKDTEIDVDCATSIQKIHQSNKLRILQLKGTDYYCDDIFSTLTNLEVLWVDNNVENSLLLYIGKLPNLKKIYLFNVSLQQDQLVTFNTERKKLAKAYKLKIYYDGYGNDLDEVEFDAIEMVRSQVWYEKEVFDNAFIANIFDLFKPVFF